MKNKPLVADINVVLQFTDEELIKKWPDRPDFIEYKNTLQTLIQTCREDQVIMAYIHDDYPRPISSHAIVVKDSHPYKILKSTDDYNIVVDIKKYMEYIKTK